MLLVNMLWPSDMILIQIILNVGKMSKKFLLLTMLLKLASGYTVENSLLSETMA